MHIRRLENFAHLSGKRQPIQHLIKMKRIIILTILNLVLQQLLLLLHHHLLLLFLLFALLEVVLACQAKIGLIGAG